MRNLLNDVPDATSMRQKKYGDGCGSGGCSADKEKSHNCGCGGGCGGTKRLGSIDLSGI